MQAKLTSDMERRNDFCDDILGKATNNQGVKKTFSTTNKHPNKMTKKTLYDCQQTVSAPQKKAGERVPGVVEPELEVFHVPAIVGLTLHGLDCVIEAFQKTVGVLWG